ncbi:uncharacterized protein LOC129913969 [Episyrphus balteatus]|uniref:uncharacterized protein LOC129913969 n=1 Tax=Episyrphus balteatus TaxID=286459 RepID=UPI002485339E|nr:uncharacterized protein LOC129913969 [Episyrphus balteatus]
MINFWNIHRKFRKIFDIYYQQILVISLIIAATLGYFHFEMQQNNQQLEHQWKQFLQLYHEQEVFIVIFPILLLLIAAMVGFIIAINLDSLRNYDQLTYLEIKKRYADYLFIQLVTRIEKTEKKLLYDRNLIPIESFIHAHEEMRKTIDKFRMDTKELLSLSEFDELVPWEMFFADDEIRRSRFLHLSMEEDVVRDLASS